MSNNPLISVITTVYNCDKYVGFAIDSILNQTYSNFEFIIINDGSTDKTWDIVKSYNDSRIIAIDNKDNKGISSRRNEAVEKASGKYIAIQDGDDVSLPKRLEYQQKALEKFGNIFCVGSWARKIDHGGNDIGIMDYPPEFNEMVCRMFLGPLNPIIDPTVMMNRQDFIDLGGYSQDIKKILVPDYDLWTRAVLSEKLFYNLLVPLIEYRINPHGNTVKYHNNMVKAHVYVMLNFINSLKNKRGIKKNC